jgi:hypothetical protein
VKGKGTVYKDASRAWALADGEVSRAGAGTYRWGEE